MAQNSMQIPRKSGSVLGATQHPAVIQLPTRKFKVDNTWVNLTPGMAVTVEIKTGTQSVASYFLSPLEQVGNESLRER